MRVLGTILALILISVYGVRSEQRLFGLARDFKTAAGVSADGLTEITFDEMAGNLFARGVLRVPEVSTQASGNSSVPEPARAYLFSGNCASAHQLAVYNSSEFNGDFEFNAEWNVFQAEFEYGYDNQSEVFSAIMIETETANYCSEITSRFAEEYQRVVDVTYAGLTFELYNTVDGKNYTTAATYVDSNATGIASLNAYILSGSDCEGVTNESLDNSTYDAWIVFSSKNADGFFVASVDFEAEIDLSGNVAIVFADASNSILRCELIASPTGELPTEEPSTPTKAPTDGPRGELPTENVSASSAVAPCIAALFLAILAL